MTRYMHIYMHVWNSHVSCRVHLEIKRDIHTNAHTHTHTKNIRLCTRKTQQHARATAVAATRLGMESYLILRQNDAKLEESVDPGLAGNLLLARYIMWVDCVHGCTTKYMYVHA